MTPRRDATLSLQATALLWAMIILELLSPIPAFLTLGAIWVMLLRPPCFLHLVQQLYGESPDDES